MQSNHIICMKLIGAWLRSFECYSRAHIHTYFQKRIPIQSFSELVITHCYKAGRKSGKQFFSLWVCWHLKSLLPFGFSSFTSNPSYDCACFFVGWFRFAHLILFACLANIKTGTISCKRTHKAQNRNIFECAHTQKWSMLFSFFLFVISFVHEKSFQRKSGFRMMAKNDSVHTICAHFSSPLNS